MVDITSTLLKVVLNRNQPLYSVSTKTPPLSIMVSYSKYWAKINVIFTTEFSIYLYIVCKNSWKFNVRIIFYHVFSTDEEL